MQASFNVSNFNRAAPILARHVSKKRTDQRVLRCTRVETVGDGIRFTTTDLDTMAVCTIPATVEEAGAVVLDFAALRRALAAAPKRGTATLRDNKVETTGAITSVESDGLSRFPWTWSTDMVRCAVWSGAYLGDAIATVLPALITEAARKRHGYGYAPLVNVHLFTESDAGLDLTVEACDGNLALRHVLRYGNGDVLDIQVPSALAESAAKLKGVAIWSIFNEQGSLALVANTSDLHVALVTNCSALDSYPDLDRVFLATEDWRGTIKKETALSLANAPVASDESVKLHAEKYSVQITSDAGAGVAAMLEDFEGAAPSDKRVRFADLRRALKIGARLTLRGGKSATTQNVLQLESGDAIAALVMF